MDISAPAQRILALVSGLPGRRREGAVLMVLQLFADDSGSEPQSSYFVLGGFVASVTDWLAFSDEWDAVLKRKPALDYFKMSEAASLGTHGQFARHKGWDEKKRDKRVRDLVSVILKYAKLRVSVAVERALFDKYIKSLAFPQRTLASDDPYYLLATHLITNVFGLVSFFSPADKCRFVFDEQLGHQGEFLLSWPSFMRLAAKNTRTNFARFIDGVPQFEDEKRFLPLQAADLYAWQVRYHLVQGRSGLLLPPTAPMQALSVVPPWDIGFNQTALIDLRRHIAAEGGRIQHSKPGLEMIHADKRAWKKARAQRKRATRV